MTMRTAVWSSFGISLVLVNLISEVGYYYTGIDVHMFLRISLVVGVTAGVSVIVGSFILVHKLEEEKPLSGHVRDTLGPDRKKS